MLGLIVGGIYFLYLAFMGGAPSVETAFLQSTEFLYGWYWVVSIIRAVIMVGIMVMTVLGFGVGGAFGGDSAFGKLGVLLGGLGGLAAAGLFAVLTTVEFVVRCAMFIGGAYLLMTAGTSGMEFADFEMWRIGVGSALIVVALILTGGNSSSSSDD